MRKRKRKRERDLDLDLDAHLPFAAPAAFSFFLSIFLSSHWLWCCYGGGCSHSSRWWWSGMKYEALGWSTKAAMFALTSTAAAAFHLLCYDSTQVNCVSVWVCCCLSWSPMQCVCGSALASLCFPRTLIKIFLVLSFFLPHPRFCFPFLFAYLHTTKELRGQWMRESDLCLVSSVLVVVSWFSSS